MSRGFFPLMPPGVWYHVIINTLSSWLPGDPRGFRNREHRIHSSGDYKRPPPKGEHANLLSYNQNRARTTVVLQPALRPLITHSFKDSFARTNWILICVSVAAEHVHGLAALPAEYTEAKRVVGRFKSYASLAVREQLPGSIWARDCTLKRVQDDGHWNATRNYITNKQECGAWVWDCDRGEWWMR